jgi:hypothetical protein
MALLAGDIGTANNALVTKAKLHGLIQERHAHGGTGGGSIEVVVGLCWKSRESGSTEGPAGLCSLQIQPENSEPVPVHACTRADVSRGTEAVG